MKRLPKYKRAKWLNQTKTLPNIIESYELLRVRNFRVGDYKRSNSSSRTKEQKRGKELIDQDGTLKCHNLNKRY
jgi:hypothetical protein